MLRSIPRAAVAAASARALAPAAAGAHVTLQPDRAPAGGFTRLDVRVPNERDDARTTQVRVQFPPGFIFVSHEPVEGWTATIAMRKLDTPVEAFGERHREEVDTVTFRTRGDGIGPGEFRDFGLSVGLPDRPGTALTFKALQTYSSGETVRWIGAPDDDEPAPQVQLTAAGPEQPAAAHGSGGSGGGKTATAAAGDRDVEDDGADTLSVVALVVAALGLLAGIAGLTAARRARAAAW